MNRQTSELLGILINHPSRFHSYEELAGHFQVSTRSIRNYIQAIRLFLRDGSREDLLSVSEKGVAFTGVYSDISFLMDHIIDDDFYLYRLSPEERIQITFFKLLLSDEPTTLSNIMESFHVSRTTVLKDMEQIRPLASHYGISFEPSLKKGYRLSLEEGQRRELILKLLHASMNQMLPYGHAANIYLRFLHMEYQAGKYVEGITDLLLSAEKAFDFTVSDDRFEQTRSCVLLVLIRCLKGKSVREEEAGILVDMPITYEIAAWLLDRAGVMYQLSFSAEERMFLARQLYGCRFYDRFSLETMQDMRLHIALTDFLRKLGAELSIPIWEDREMAVQLERHLKDITNAHLRGITFENEYAKQLIAEYESYYQAIRKHVAVLENYAGYRYSDDTISFILMYLVTAVDHYLQDRLLPKAVVVCHMGICTANFLAQRLKMHVQIHIAAITSNHKLSEILEKQDFDLIISTISLEEQKLPWIKVSPMLNESDIFLLQKELLKISMRKQKEQSQGDGRNGAVCFEAHSILRQENILLDVPCKTWQEAIRQAARPLLAERAVTAGYVDAILASAERNGAYFVYCPQVALAHAGPNDGVLKFGISLIRLQTELAFGHPVHDPVRYVICLAARQDEPLLQEVLKIMDLLSREEIRKELDGLQSPEEFFTYFIKRESEGT